MKEKHQSAINMWRATKKNTMNMQYERPPIRPKIKTRFSPNKYCNVREQIESWKVSNLYKKIYKCPIITS